MEEASCNPSVIRNGRSNRTLHTRRVKDELDGWGGNARRAVELEGQQLSATALGIHLLVFRKQFSAA